MHIPNIFKANKNNPRCGFHALQKKLIYKKIDLWLQFLGGLVCFHPNKSTLIFSLQIEGIFFWHQTSFINGFQKDSNVMMMIDLHPSPLVLDAPNLSQI